MNVSFFPRLSTALITFGGTAFISMLINVCGHTFCTIVSSDVDDYLFRFAVFFLLFFRKYNIHIVHCVPIGHTGCSQTTVGIIREEAQNKKNRRAYNVIEISNEQKEIFFISVMTFWRYIK